jgi:arsenate reductase
MATTCIMYGIKNCDTVKKARVWLETHNVPYQFHDYKTAGADRARLERWCATFGWEAILNRAGTTFRKLPDNDKTGLTTEKAIALMVRQPSMIKRPIVESGDRTIVGFDAARYDETFG